MSEPIVLDQEFEGVLRREAGWAFVLYRDNATGRLYQTAGSVMVLSTHTRGPFRLEVSLFDGDAALGVVVIDRERYTVYSVTPASEALVRGYAERNRLVQERGPQGQLRIDL